MRSIRCHVASNYVEQYMDFKALGLTLMPPCPLQHLSWITARDVYSGKEASDTNRAAERVTDPAKRQFYAELAESQRAAIWGDGRGELQRQFGQDHDAATDDEGSASDEDWISAMQEE